MEIVKEINSLGEEIASIIEGHCFNNFGQNIQQLIHSAKHINHWFTEEAIILRLKAISNYLSAERFGTFLNHSCNRTSIVNSKIGVISEENIPIQEFTLLLNIILSGNSFYYKTSEKSDKLIPFIFSEIGNRIPELSASINFTEGSIKNLDAYILTLQDKITSAQISYFSQKKSLIEVRHQSAAILNGNETQEELVFLGNDIFNFYGQGAGNVKKIYVPINYNFKNFFESVEPWHFIMNTSAWANNYQYHQTVYLMNQIEHLDNGFLLLRKSNEMKAPTGVLYYESYIDFNKTIETLEMSDKVFSIFSSAYKKIKSKAFGDSANQLLDTSEKLIRFLS